MTPASHPKVSIILPVYNAESYVKGALLRLLDQTFIDFELIVVDDSSMDRTRDLAQSVARQDVRVRVIELPVNGGVASARNDGLALATGTYVWFVDVDDAWDDGFLARTVDALERRSADLAVCSAVHRFGSDWSSNEFVVRYRNENVLEGIEAVESLLAGSGALWNKLFRRDVLGLNPFPPLRSKSDHAGVLLVLPELRRIVTVPEVLYTYVQRDGSISNGGNPQPQNFLVLLGIAAASLGQFPNTRRFRHAHARFRCSIIARALREAWRYPTGASELAKQLPTMVTWREVLLTGASDRRAFVTCAAAKIAPRSAKRAFRHIGRNRWTTQGAV
ncbi:glycosyltransferase family 2 protein [Agromyces larvae]|uniref:Glycosyltransferase n=1 Tax=Agromyces larvae TaxID=2929802 RepID=A0ABY4C2D3_9MICO|nr:glycosyltransferase family 2 protein [Agromyces larvae]UOE44311.1 glycosyltransferase [Agromyces larvae]